MLKEIVDFSKELERHGIYDIIQENQRKIDKPIMVIPVSDDLTEIQVDDAYFVFKDYEKIEKNSQTELNLFLDTSDQKLKKIETNNFENYSLKIKKLNELDDRWQNILLNYKQYTLKPSSDKKGGKSIGKNAGSNSYNILIFEGKEDTLFKDLKTFKQKLKNTYGNDKNINTGVIESFQFYKTKYLFLLKQLSDDSYLENLYDQIKTLFNTTQQYDEKKKGLINSFTQIVIILQLPNHCFNINNRYKKWYERYLLKKLFKTEENKYPKGTCPTCMISDKEMWVPDAFNTLNEKKYFLKHLDRTIHNNIYICRQCCFSLFMFQEYFLSELRITLFPLFITKKEKKEMINFIKNNNEKLNFKTIIEDIYRKTNQNEFDFYLIIYSRKNKFITFDYISGFYFFRKNMSVFQIEDLIKNSFFIDQKNNEKLSNNYFSDEVDTGNNYLNQLIYRYRNQIFDYIYRANYHSITTKNIKDIYCEFLNLKLKNLLDPKTKEEEIISMIYKANKNFLVLDEYFGGNFMTKLETIKQSNQINDSESFAYHTGRIVYYLLSQSKKDEKNHSLVEPFINIASLKVLAMKLDDVFNAYKHEINIDNDQFNNLFSQIWEFIYENKDYEFTRELKILFYAGYFDTYNKLKISKKGV